MVVSLQTIILILKQLSYLQYFKAVFLKLIFGIVHWQKKQSYPFIRHHPFIR